MSASRWSLSPSSTLPAGSPWHPACSSRRGTTPGEPPSARSGNFWRVEREPHQFAGQTQPLSNEQHSLLCNSPILRPHAARRWQNMTTRKLLASASQAKNASNKPPLCGVPYFCVYFEAKSCSVTGFACLVDFTSCQRRCPPFQPQPFLILDSPFTIRSHSGSSTRRGAWGTTGRVGCQ